MSTKKSEAKRYLEKIAGEALTLGNYMASIRKGEEMTLGEFGKTLGVSASHLSDIEKGRKLVSPNLAAQYAKKLGYSEKQFVRLSLQDSLNRQGLKKYHVKIEAA